MFLHKRRSTGYWYLYYQDEAGKKRSVSTRHKKKPGAVEFLRTFKAREEEARRRVRNITLSVFIKEYLKSSKSYHTPNSHESARAALNEFIKIIGDITLAKITSRDVENFVQVKRGVSVHTARRCYVTVRAALQKAVDWEYLSVNPFAKVTKPVAPEAPPLFFSKEEFRRLLDVIDSEDFRLFCIVAVSTGLRLGELINLKWEHINLDGHVIHVQNSNEFTTKSKRNRVVPMNQIIHEMLSRRKENAATPYVFHRAGRKLDKDYVSKKFKRYVLTAGVNDKLHFHSLRHSAASWLVQSGVSIFVVQQILGHSSVGVTEKYAHLQPTHLSDAVARVNYAGVLGLGGAA
jgi:integrase